MTKFMSHRVTENDRHADVAFRLQFQCRFIEEVDVAPFAVGLLKRHAPA